MPTIDSSKVLAWEPYTVYEEQWSALDAGAAVDLSWTAADGPALAPHSVSMEVLTRPTDRSPVQLHRDTANDAPSSRTIRLSVDTEAGGSLTGAVVSIKLTWIATASGGTS